MKPDGPKPIPAQSIEIGGDVSGTVQNVGTAEIVVQATGDATVTINKGISLEEYTTALFKREAELRAEFASASQEEKTRVQGQITEIERQKSDIEASFKQAQEDLRLLRNELKAIAENAPQEKLDAALTALYAGNRTLADQLLKDIEEAEQSGIERAAHARGEIAEQEIRWKDAYTHYSRATALHPTSNNLAKAYMFAWRAGFYDEALSFGKNRITVTLNKYGEDSPEHATALNDQAINLKATGEYDLAEPLYLQAIEIDKKPSARITQTMQSASTIWQSYKRPQANTIWQSRSTYKPSRSVKSPSAKITQTMQSASTIWQGCIGPQANTIWQSRFT